MEVIYGNFQSTVSNPLKVLLESTNTRREIILETRNIWKESYYTISELLYFIGEPFTSIDTSSRLNSSSGLPNFLGTFPIDNKSIRILKGFDVSSMFRFVSVI